MLMALQRLMAVVAVAALLAGCEGTTATKEDEGQGAAVSESAASSGTGSGASTSGVGTAGGFQGHPLDDPASALSRRTILFEFDSAEITDQYRPVVEAHAAYLAANPTARVVLEGHTDERGSREYNIGLGERRANAVRQLMTLLGASGAQVFTVSYGEERPVAEGHDESAWSLNRRVEIVYRNR